MDLVKQESKKKIGMIGDYDVDGSSATSLLCNFFSDIGVSYEFYIPDRIKEGYGPNINAFKSLKKKGCNLVLTLDCGTTANESINLIVKEKNKLNIQGSQTNQKNVLNSLMQ